MRETPYTAENNFNRKEIQLVHFGRSAICCLGAWSKQGIKTRDALGSIKWENGKVSAYGIRYIFGMI